MATRGVVLQAARLPGDATTAGQGGQGGQLGAGGDEGQDEQYHPPHHHISALLLFPFFSLCGGINPLKI